MIGRKEKNKSLLNKRHMKLNERKYKPSMKLHKFLISLNINYEAGSINRSLQHRFIDPDYEVYSLYKYIIISTADCFLRALELA